MYTFTTYTAHTHKCIYHTHIQHILTNAHLTLIQTHISNQTYTYNINSHTHIIHTPHIHKPYTYTKYTCMHTYTIYRYLILTYTT